MIRKIIKAQRQGSKLTWVYAFVSIHDQVVSELGGAV